MLTETRRTTRLSKSNPIEVKAAFFPSFTTEMISRISILSYHVRNAYLDVGGVAEPDDVEAAVAEVDLERGPVDVDVGHPVGVVGVGHGVGQHVRHHVVLLLPETHTSAITATITLICTHSRLPQR